MLSSLWPRTSLWLGRSRHNPSCGGKREPRGGRAPKTAASRHAEHARVTPTLPLSQAIKKLEEGSRTGARPGPAPAPVDEASPGHTVTPVPLLAVHGHFDRSPKRRLAGNGTASSVPTSHAARHRGHQTRVSAHLPSKPENSVARSGELATFSVPNGHMFRARLEAGDHGRGRRRTAPPSPGPGGRCEFRI